VRTGAHLDEGQDPRHCLGRQVEVRAGEGLAHVLGAALVQLVHLAQDQRLLLRIGHAQRLEEPAHQLAVVQLHTEGADAQLGEHRVDHRHHLGVVADGQGVLADDVDVALVELAEAAALGALAAVHALHLVAAEREAQLVLVLGHVAGQRHGQVEAQGQLRQPGGGTGGGVGQRAGGLDEIDLPFGLTARLGQQHLGQLEDGGFHRQEAEALVVAPDDVEHALEGDLLARQQFQDARWGTGPDQRKTPAGERMDGTRNSTASRPPSRHAAQPTGMM